MPLLRKKRSQPVATSVGSQGHLDMLQPPRAGAGDDVAAVTRLQGSLGEILQDVEVAMLGRREQTRLVLSLPCGPDGFGLSLDARGVVRRAAGAAADSGVGVLRGDRVVEVR